MDRINGANWVDIGGGKRGWRQQNKAAGISGTEMTAAYYNGLQEELVGLIEAAGLTPNPADWTQVKQAIDLLRANYITSLGLRSRLTADTNFYVSTAGSDVTGTGDAAKPWATIQKGVDTLIAGWDFRGYTATINVADGSFAPFRVDKTLPNGALKISGNTLTPANCIITGAGDSITSVYNPIAVQGFKFISTAGSALRCFRGGQIELVGKVDFGACAVAHTNALDSGSRIILSSDYAISGGAQNHLLAWYGGAEVSTSKAITVTLSGAPAFSVFAYAENLCVVRGTGITWSGSATGVRYSAATGGVIDTGGGGANFFPGNSAGSVPNSFQYR